MTDGVDTGFPHDRKKDFEQLRLRRKLAVYFHTDAGNLCIPDKLRHIVLGIDVFLTQYLGGTAKLPDSGGVFFGNGVLPQNLFFCLFLYLFLFRLSCVRCRVPHDIPSTPRL